MLGTGHPTIKNFKQASMVLNRFHSEFKNPELSEGYNRILYLKPSDHPSSHWLPEEITAVLSRLEKSTPRGLETPDGAETLAMVAS
jgi:hypothetical protein